VQYPIGLSAAWDDLLTYCTDDDELLERLHSAVIGYAEEDVVEVHQVVNDRGIPIDVAFAARLALLQDELSVKSGLTMSSITEGDLEMHDARSAVKVKKWLLANGVTLPQREGRDSLDRRDVKRMLDDPEEFCDGTEESAALACAVLKLRQEVVRVTSGKAIRMIEAAGEDGRARGQFVYHGAHTGRWSARQVQPHNFPRGLEDIDHSLARFDLKLCEVEAEAERLQVEARKTTPGARVSAGDVLATLLRPVIDGPLCIGDYGAVEARGVNWVADEKRSLALFSDPEADVYVDLARKVFGKQDISKGERWHAKQAELGCGYGMSHRKFRGMVEALGVTMPDGVSAEHIIKTYRAQHQGVVRGWKELEAAVLGAAEGRDTTACRASFYRDGPSVVMKLPSGRRLVYRDARVEQRVPMYCALLGLPPEKKPTFVYRHPYGWEGTLYGGRIMENLVQALCRDLLADALIRAERAGMKPCMHVHDELVAEMDDPRALAELMSTPPAWADGFPVLVEAFFAPRYFKKAGKDSVVSKMLNGR
jgi:DNA polymerase